MTAYASLAAAASSAAVGGTADAATVVSNALVNKTINWDTGAGNFASVKVTAAGTAGDAFGGLLAAGGGFKLNTRATAGGGVSASSFVGVVVAWQGGGNGVFRRNFTATATSFGNGALLASYGSTATAGSSASSFANVNVGSSLSDVGNASFNGTSPGTSMYLLFSFTGTDTNTYYGWIEILATTNGFSSTSQYSATLGRWAYDNQAGYALKAGEINAAAVPGGAGLAALAFGAAGLRGRRRGRN